MNHLAMVFSSVSLEKNSELIKRDIRRAHMERVHLRKNRENKARRPLVAIGERMILDEKIEISKCFLGRGSVELMPEVAAVDALDDRLDPFLYPRDEREGHKSFFTKRLVYLTDVFRGEWSKCFSFLRHSREGIRVWISFRQTGVPKPSETRDPPFSFLRKNFQKKVVGNISAYIRFFAV